MKSLFFLAIAYIHIAMINFVPVLGAASPKNDLEAEAMDDLPVGPDWLASPEFV
ncbi:hypothetical protein ARMSODRAFT_962188 [Armillaria solidipes]|uniref:Uncharacterized protein n=1 Tax=Armillaria solidipes TaxID=1076256 RepID=A0A2H3B0E8_9AGAR|nr:hypothetical protein ARMSODRAFT_962188 [Armillaria solidipes]